MKDSPFGTSPFPQAADLYNGNPCVFLRSSDIATQVGSRLADVIIAVPRFNWGASNHPAGVYRATNHGRWSQAVVGQERIMCRKQARPPMHVPLFAQ